MLSRCFVFLFLLIVLASAGWGATPPRMRPYSGIGVVVLPGTGSGQAATQPVYLYQEPGLYRLGILSIEKLAGNEWIFGSHSVHVPLIVLARRGTWLRVCYDDAGREAWLNPQRKDAFRPWDDFLKSRMSRMLPGLRKQNYQLYLKPDQNPGVTLTPKQSFKVLKLEHDWALVLLDQATIGWLRWRDEDGRLTIGLD